MWVLSLALALSVSLSVSFGWNRTTTWSFSNPEIQVFVSIVRSVVLFLQRSLSQSVRCSVFRLQLQPTFDCGCGALPVRSRLVRWHEQCKLLSKQLHWASLVQGNFPDEVEQADDHRRAGVHRGDPAPPGDQTMTKKRTRWRVCKKI